MEPDLPAPPLRGRSSELARLTDAVARAGSGSGSFLVLDGAAGVGKSALLRALFATATADSRWRTLRIEGDELLEGVPLGALLREVSADDGWVGLRATVTALESNVVGAEMQILDSVVADLVDVAVDGPLLIVADDAQWIDDLTLRILGAVGRRAPGSSLLVVLATRPTDRRLVVLARRTATRLELGGLGRAAVLAMAEDAMGAPPSPSLRDALVRADGSPFWVERICRVHQTTFDVPRGAVEPGAAPDVLDSLRTLGETGLQVLSCAALMGTRFEPDRLARSLETPLETIEVSLRDAEALGAVQSSPSWRFSHDLVRQAVAAEIDPGYAAEFRRTLGTDVAETDAVAASAYLRDLDLVADAEVGMVLLRAAAATVSRTVDEAATLAERGWRSLPSSHPARHAVGPALVGMLVSAGRAEDAISLAREVLATTPPPDIEAQVRIAWAAAEWLSNRSAEGVAVLAPTRELVGLSDETTAAVQAWSGRVLFWSGELDEARAAATAAVTVAGRHQVVGRSTLAMIAAARGDAIDSVALASVSLRADPVTAPSLLPETLGDPAGLDTVLGSRLIEVDRFDEADAAFERALARVELASLLRLTTCHLGLAATRGLRGDLDGAVVEMDLVRQLAADAGADVAFPAAEAVRAEVAYRRGDLGAAADFVAAGIEAYFRPGSNAGLDLLVKLDLLVGEATDPASALDRLRLVREIGAAVRYLSVWKVASPVAVRVARDHDRTLAEAITHEAEEGVRRCPDVASTRAVGLRCRGLLDRDADALVAAAEAYGASPRVVDELETRIEAAELLTARGDRADALAHLERAGELAERLGHEPARLQVRAGLRRLGRRPRPAGGGGRAKVGWAALSATESDVVELVAQGLTNREIGARLYIGHRTVETHLGHVFVKVGLRSRVEVATAWRDLHPRQ